MYNIGLFGAILVALTFIILVPIIIAVGNENAVSYNTASFMGSVLTGTSYITYIVGLIPISQREEFNNIMTRDTEIQMAKQ